MLALPSSFLLFIYRLVWLRSCFFPAITTKNLLVYALLSLTGITLNLTSITLNLTGNTLNLTGITLNLTGITLNLTGQKNCFREKAIAEQM